MIFRLIAILGLLFLVFWAANSVSRKFSLSKNQARLLMMLSVFMTAIVVLIVIGRLPVAFIIAPLGVAATFLLRMLPTLLRLFPLWQMLHSRFKFNRATASTGDSQKSTLRTAFLVMELVHGSGEMDGSVLKGTFQGQKLSQLSREQLLKFYAECQEDADSRQIFEAYMDRIHPDWRATGEHHEQSHAADETVLSRELALEILGLCDPVGRKDITSAHRKLMQKLHPDRGGTDYLAKKINAARDCLLAQVPDE